MDAIQEIINEDRPADIICVSNSRARYKVRTWYKMGVHDGYDYAIKVKRKQMIDKIVKWLDDNAFEYVKTETSGIDIIYKGFNSEKMITDLIKAIKE